MRGARNVEVDYQLLYNVLFENSSDWVLALDNELKLLDANSTFLKEFTLTKDTVKDIYFPTLCQQIEMECPIDLDDRKPSEGQSVFYHETVNGYDVSWIIQNIHGNGKVKYFLIGKFPEYKEIINKYLQLETMIEHMPGNVYWMNKDLTHLGCNKNVLDMLGISKEKYIGSTYEELSKWASWPEGLVEAFKEADFQVLKTGKAIFNIEEPPFKHHDGHLLYFLTSRVPLYDSSGDVVGVAGISTDITELKKSQLDLKRAVERSELANKAKSEFIANMSHDIRTPIVGMIALIQVLYDHANNKQLKHDAHTLMNTTSELLKLLNEIIEVVKIESGEIAQGTTKAFNLKDVIIHNAKLIKPALDAKKIQFLLVFPDELPTCYVGCKSYIDRVLLNLLGNAAKFTEKGHVKITIKSLEKQCDTIILQIAVEDTGIGIPEDKQAVIFEHFSRLTPSYQGRYEGYGLGLYTVKNYLHAIKGTVTVSSKLKEGSLFTVTLPLTIAESQNIREEITELLDESGQEPEATDMSHTEPSSGSDKVHILIVEDNPLAAKMAITQLQHFDCKVDLAVTGQEATEAVTQHHYDFIFMDLGLPDQDGYAVTKQIRQLSDKQKAKIPIVALSAHAGTEYHQKCLNAGMNDMITKPLTPKKAKELLTQYTDIFLSASKTPSLPSENKKQKVKSTLVMSAQAKEMADMLTEMLTGTEQALQHAYELKDVKALFNVVHKLQGGICYCGTPELIRSTQALHDALQKNQLQWSEIIELYHTLRCDIELYLNQC